MTESTQLTRAGRREELAQTEFGTQGGQLMVPKNGRELLDMAEMMSKSDFMVRDFYRGNPGACAALIMVTAAYGMNPFQVSWKTYKASKGQDAPISFEAQLVNAMVNISAPIKGKLQYEYSGDGQTRRCKVTGIDRETGAALEYETPEVGKITVKNSPLWKNDPDQQLGYYASRSWCRRHFPEMLLGVYSRDEIDEHRGPDRAKDITPSLAERVAEAVEREAAEGEVFPPETEDAAPAPSDRVVDGTTEPDPDMGDPTTLEYGEGRAARENGEPYDANPGKDSEARNDWAAGWRAMDQELSE